MPEHQDNSAQFFKELKRSFFNQEIENFNEFLKGLDGWLEVRRQELSKNIDVADSDLETIRNDPERRRE